MRLVDFLEVVNENLDVQVYENFYGTLLSVYDGKNSIDTALNDRIIEQIDCADGAILVTLK